MVQKMDLFVEKVTEMNQSGRICIGESDKSLGFFIHKQDCLCIKTSLDIALIELAKSQNKAVKAAVEDLRFLSAMLGDAG